MVGILIALLIPAFGQPKNLKDFKRNCEKYLFNIENVDFKTTTPSKFYIEQLIIEDWPDSISYYHGICRIPVPVVFEDNLAKVLKGRIASIYSDLQGEIPIVMNIKKFTYLEVPNGPDLFNMLVEYFAYDEDKALKPIFATNLHEEAYGAYFEKKLSQLLKKSLFELHYKDAFNRNLPYYSISQRSDTSKRYGILFSWEDVLNLNPIMNYPCDTEIHVNHRNYPWFKMKNCQYRDVYDPKDIYGVYLNDSLFIRTYKERFIYLKPLGNHFFLAKDHIFDHDIVSINALLWGAVGALIARAGTDKYVFYVFDPNGEITVYDRFSLRQEVNKHKDLKSKYELLLKRADGISVENKELFITEILRRQGKIPPQ